MKLRNQIVELDNSLKGATGKLVYFLQGLTFATRRNKEWTTCCQLVL
jgi:hypothetical protein